LKISLCMSVWMVLLQLHKKMVTEKTLKDE